MIDSVTDDTRARKVLQEFREGFSNAEVQLRGDFQQISEYGIKILGYIKAQPGKNVNEVVAAMDKKVCSRMTTLREIDKLLSAGIIEDRKEGNSFHRLYYNDNSLVNRMNQELTRIESFIDAGYKPTKRMFEKHWIKDKDAELIELEFAYPSYKHAIDTFLRVLLFQTSTKIPNQDSRRELYAKIIRLMLKHNSEYLTDAVNLLDYSADMLSTFSDKVLSNPIQTEGAKKKSKLYVKLANDMAENIRDFKKEFLEAK